MLESLLLSLDESQEKQKSKSTQNEKQFKQIISILNDCCDKNVSVDDVATLCNMSTSNLKRIFSMYSDIGIAKYHLKLKLRKACEMLVNNISTAEIAENLGFSSTAYFNTTFKREMGITPAKYKRSKQ